MGDAWWREWSTCVGGNGCFYGSANTASCYSKPFKAVRSEDAAVPEAVRAKAEKCAARLRKRRAALKKRGVSANKAKVAVARELAEWIYHIAVMPA